MDFIRELAGESCKKYPDVKFKFAEAKEAFREAIWPGGINDDALELDVSFHPESSDDVPSIEVSTKSGKVFGPQPFLAIKTKSGRYIHDNFDFATSLDRWFYAFHLNTLPLEDVAEVAIAANDQYGNMSLKNLDASVLGRKG